MLWACTRGHETVIPCLLQGRVVENDSAAVLSVNVIDQMSQTPLMLCCSKGDIDSVHMLLQAKADVFPWVRGRRCQVGRGEVAMRLTYGKRHCLR